LFAREIRRRRVTQFQGFRHWRWHLDEVWITRAKSWSHS
jgi:putative transposase